MAIRMKLRGLEEVKRTLRSLPKEVRAEVDKALGTGAQLIANDVVRSITTGARTGRMYGDHQASAPGEPPASRTGELANSIRVHRGVGIERQIVAGAQHGGFLERGTRAMDPRPYLKPALDRGKALIKFLVKSAIERALRRISKGKRRKRR